MDTSKEKFFGNEFLTMSLLGALGRSKTYSQSVSDQDKSLFRIALREKLSEIGNKYVSPVTEEEHLSNMTKLADDLSSKFSHCLKNGRFRIGIAQKALNLYLKYLWCVGLIPTPPHCPFDSIVISYIPGCSNLNWTSIDAIGDYKKLVNTARKKADGKPIGEWELEIWLKSVQSAREQKGVKWSANEKGRAGTLAEPSQPNILSKEGEAMIIGAVTSPGKDICELIIYKESSNRLPHEYRQKKPIEIIIGNTLYEAGVHETQKGVVWISSVLYEKGSRREKVRLVDALAKIKVKKRDKVRIKLNEEGIFLLEKEDKRMPVIARFYGIIIKMYFSKSEHGVSHFHAIYGEFNAVFAIESLEMIEGDLPGRAQRLVKEWAGFYQKELLEMWNRQEYKQLPGLE